MSTTLPALVLLCRLIVGVIFHRTPELYRQQAENNERYRDALASVSVIQGAGHYVRTSSYITTAVILTIVTHVASCANAG